MAKRNNDNDEKQDNLNDADNFGLPDLDYKPLDPVENTSQQNSEPVYQPIEEEQQRPVDESEYVVEEEKIPLPPQSSATSTAVYEQVEKSNAPVIIGVIISLAVIIGAALIYLYVYKPAAEEKARQEQLAAAEAKRQREAAALKAQQEEEERRRREAEQVVAAPTIGTIETLSDRTGRYYVVVSSAVDGDLIMDYAKKLSSGGTSSKIIPPFGKWKFYRLAIGDYDSFDAAQASADESKATFGEGAWVIKY